jgi:hypothetical protein
MTRYDPHVLQRFAERLYARAFWTVVTVTLSGVVTGALTGLGLSAQVPEHGPLVGASVGALLGGVLGFLVGNERAFTLRLQAQLALCQMCIELNTRRPTVAHGSNAPYPVQQ